MFGRYEDPDAPSRQECEREAYEQRLWEGSRLRLKSPWKLEGSEEDGITWWRTEFRTRKARRDYPGISKGDLYTESKTFSIEDETSKRYISTVRRPLRHVVGR